jgi:hypothetical protein
MYVIFQKSEIFEKWEKSAQSIMKSKRILPVSTYVLQKIW